MPTLLSDIKAAVYVWSVQIRKVWVVVVVDLITGGKGGGWTWPWEAIKGGPCNAYLMPLEFIIIGDRNDQCIDTTLAESKWGTSPGIMSIELNIFGCVWVGGNNFNRALWYYEDFYCHFISVWWNNTLIGAKGIKKWSAIPPAFDVWVFVLCGCFVKIGSLETEWNTF